MRADDVAASLDDPRLRVLEIDVSPSAYSEGHIPGAVLWNAYADLRDAAYQPVGRERLAQLLGEAGVTPETTVVTHGYAAPLGLWLLREFGHDDVRMLEGRRDCWTDAGFRWERAVAAHLTADYPVPAENAGLIATFDDVRSAIEDPDVVLLDVRSELEYDGERFWPSGATADTGRSGHIPDAVNVPIGDLRADDESLKSADLLRRVFADAGVDGSKPIIAYCTIGNRAGQAWFGMTELLGFPDVKVYYGSWVEWGRREDTPIEAEPA